MMKDKIIYLFIVLFICVPSSFSQQLVGQGFSNQHFRILAVESQPPFLFFPDTENPSFSGFLIDLFAAVLSGAGANNTFQIVDSTASPPNTSLGFPSGIDVILSDVPLNMHPLSVSQGSYSTPFLQSSLSIVTQVDTRSPDPLSFMQPFSINLWILVFSTVIAAGLVLWLLDHLSPYGYFQQYRVGEGARYWNNVSHSVFNAFTSDFFRKSGTSGNRGRNIAYRLFLIVFLFWSFIIWSTYTGNLSALLIQNPYAYPTSLEAIVYASRPFGIVAGSETAEYFDTQTRLNPLFIQAKKLRTDYPSMDAALAALHADDVRAVIAPTFALNYAVSESGCKLIVPGSLGQMFYGFFFAKGHPLVPEFNLQLSVLVVKQTVNALLHNWTAVRDCQPQTFASGRVRQLDIPQLAGTWYMMLIFAGISGLILLVEIGVYSKRSERQPNRLLDRLLRFFGDRSHLKSYQAALEKLQEKQQVKLQEQASRDEF